MLQLNASALNRGSKQWYDEVFINQQPVKFVWRYPKGRIAHSAIMISEDEYQKLFEEICSLKDRLNHGELR